MGLLLHGLDSSNGVSSVCGGRSLWVTVCQMLFLEVGYGLWLYVMVMVYVMIYMVICQLVE